jgi:hypothetical protein
VTPAERRERHREAQARYRASANGRETIERYRVRYVETGKHCDAQARYRRRQAEASDTAPFDRLGESAFLAHLNRESRLI